MLNFKRFIIIKEAISEAAYDDWVNNNNDNGGADHIDISDALLNKHLNKHDNKTKKHIREYTDYSKTLNKKLINRHKFKTGNASDNSLFDRNEFNQIKHLDKVTKKPIGHEVHVYSGIGFDPHKHMNPEHNTIHLPAYTSTTHDKQIAHDFVASHYKDDVTHHHILHIHMKPTDKAAHVSHLSKHPSEYETILPRNTTLKVHPTPDILDHEDDNFGKRITHVWHATIHKQQQ